LEVTLAARCLARERKFERCIHQFRRWLFQQRLSPGAVLGALDSLLTDRIGRKKLFSSRWRSISPPRRTGAVLNL